jgi:1,4-alpha-glucan branching enzyme
VLFENLNLIEPILKALTREGYTTPTPIQAQAIPVILEKRDLLGCAQTGTGKTAAFAIPVLQLLHNENTGTHKRNIRALVLTPTRELAIQIGESFTAYGKYTGLKHAVVYGGVSQYQQTNALKAGLDILIATPGRLLDLMNQGFVHLQHIKMFVLDEADRMLDMGFINDIRKIIAKLPAKKQTLFFSATMPVEIQKLANSILSNPVKVQITTVISTENLIQQGVYFVEQTNKKSLLVHLLKDKAVISALVFTRTKHNADKVTREINRSGVYAEAIHGNKSQHARQAALQNFKNKRIRGLMPINPIGELNRKGSLGSYYSIKDYTAVNPEFGTLDDFKHLVDEIHKAGLYVIIDWVANHSAFDNAWVSQHPGWYTRDDKGKIIPPVADWSDVADLNYDDVSFRNEMLNAMKFWVAEAKIDGYRCDVAMMVPIDFWRNTVAELQKIKPDVFMLAEAEGREFHANGFDMTYAWNMHSKMNQIAQGKSKPTVIDSLIQAELGAYPKDAYRMQFTSNHDENSWNGTEFERMGNAAQIFAVLSATIPGMLLIYSGQEVGLSKRLRFFDKDTIQWNDDHSYTEFYEKLIEMKKDNPALWNGNYGGSYREINDLNEKVFCFAREKNNDKMIIILNLSDEKQHTTITGEAGKYKNAFTGENMKMKESTAFDLEGWSYVLLYKRELKKL